MTKVLVVYATTDGHTAKVAREIGVRLRDCGVDARVLIASRDLPRPDEYDGVIVAASLHAGRYQRSVRRWVRRHVHEFGSTPTAFVSVCLMIRNPAAAPHLAAVMSRFLDECHWKPTITKPVAGAIAYTRYGWLKRWLMKRIAARTGGDTDISRDHVYTDWEDLRRFATDFGRALGTRRPSLSSAA